MTRARAYVECVEELQGSLCGLAAEIFNGAKGDQFTGLTLDKVRLLTELEDRTLALY